MPAVQKIQKITAHLPADLLARAQAATGKGITETLREGLAALTARDAQRQLLAMRGKVRLKIDLEAVRKDKR
jgi:hypothetical protein